MHNDEIVNVNLGVKAEIHIHHHYHHSSSQPGAADIINAIRDSKEAIMTQLDISAAKESQDTSALVAAVTAMAAAIDQLRSQNNSGLQAALDAANLDASQQAAILDANDKAVNDALDAANAALNPPTPTPVPPTPPTPVVVGAALPDATTGQGYAAALDITGGTSPYSVIVDTATVNGLSMDGLGNVSGSSTADGVVTFSGTVADSSTPNQHVPFSVTFNSVPPVVTV